MNRFVLDFWWRAVPAVAAAMEEGHEQRKRFAAEAPVGPPRPGAVGPARPSAPGPAAAPTAAAPKRAKTLEFEHVYVEQLPCAQQYETSFMHAAHVTHVLVTPHTA